MASIRRDGSSSFGEDTKWGLFPAVSVGWRVSQEDFLIDNSVISDLKVRASFGQNGKNAAGAYDHLGLVSPTSAIIAGQSTTGFYPSQGANPLLAWQKSTEINFGFDLGLYKDRIFASFEVYSKQSEDLLLNMPTSIITGYESAIMNIGQVDNKGFEIELSSFNVVTDNFSWKSSATFTKNKTTLVDFGGADSTISTVESKRPFEFMAIEGENIVNYWGYEMEKDIDPQYLNNPYYPIGGVAQDAYIVDQNGDGVIDDRDKKVLGSPDPDFVWSLTNSFTYKNFDLSFTFQGSHGAEVVNMDRQYLENLFSSNMDYNSSFTDADMVEQKIFTDYLVQDASYIALRTFNLGYTLPGSFASKFGLENTRIYIAANNMFYWWSDEYTSYNPEGNFVNDDMTPLTVGYQKGSAPLAKTFIVGLSLNF